MKAEECTLFSGGAKGAEAEFGLAAEKAGMDEVNFTFEGHQDARQRGLRHLTHEELLHGDVSLSYVSKLMNRNCWPRQPSRLGSAIWQLPIRAPIRWRQCCSDCCEAPACAVWRGFHATEL